MPPPPLTLSISPTYTQTLDEYLGGYPRPALHIQLLDFIQSTVFRRDDTTQQDQQSSNQIQAQQTISSAPSLSPSAIVGIAIIGAMFFCVAAAAMLRYFTRSDPSANVNASSLYRPEDAGQLERMKEVREFNRMAAWERAEEARIVSEMSSRTKSGYTLGEMGDKDGERVMMGRVLAAVSGRPGKYQSGGGSPVKMGMGPGTVKEQWRRRMSVSAMEAQGAFDVDSGENWPLVGGQPPRNRQTLAGGSKDYSDGAYVDADTSSDSTGAGGSGSSSNSKGKRPERFLGGIGGGDPTEAKRFTCPPALGYGGGDFDVGASLAYQQRQVRAEERRARMPDYYD